MAKAYRLEATMKRVLSGCAVLLTAALVAPALRADVKTTEKSSVVFEGLMGAMMNRFSGGSKGTTTTVAVKGSRMSRMSDATGQIIDLSEEKIYTVDTRRKEYTVMTFAQMREQMEKMKADMAKRQEEMTAEQKQAMQDLKDAGKELEFDVEVKPTGQQKAIVGHDAKEFVVTISMHQKGMKIEQSGGLMTTTNVWLAPRIAALDEMRDFNLKFAKAIFGDMFSGTNPQQMGALSAMIPGLATLMERMATETRKLEGTPVASTTVIESVKSAEQMKNAAAPPSGGGIGGMIARRMARGSSEPRSKVMTSSSETLTIAATASAEDVAIPADFKEKK
jgi:hypothetical protein